MRCDVLWGNFDGFIEIGNSPGIIEVLKFIEPGLLEGVWVTGRSWLPRCLRGCLSLCLPHILSVKVSGVSPALKVRLLILLPFLPFSFVILYIKNIFVHCKKDNSINKRYKPRQPKEKYVQNSPSNLSQIEPVNPERPKKKC